MSDDPFERARDPELLALARAAMDIEADMERPAVKAVLEAARDDADMVMRDFVEVDPFDGPKVRLLQWRALRALSYAGWFARQIEPGKAAAAQYQGRDPAVGSALD